MAGEVREILLRIRGDSREAQQAQAAVQTGFGGIASAAAIATAAVAAVAGGVATLVATINRGQGVSELSTAFDNLGGSLPRLRESTQGLVSDLDLMRASNQAMLAGLSATQFEQVAAAADALGDAVGVGTKEAMDGLTLSIASGNERMLKQFGILVDNKKAEEDFAASIGVTASQLNEAGKLEAFRIAALAEMAEKATALGEAHATAGDGLQQMGKAADNLFDRFAQGVNENDDLAEALANLAGAIASIDVEPLVEVVNALVDLVAVPINYISDKVKIVRELAGAIRDLGKTEEEQAADRRAYASELIESDAQVALTQLDEELRVRKSRDSYIDYGKAAREAAQAAREHAQQVKEGQKALADFNTYGYKYVDWLNESAEALGKQFLPDWEESKKQMKEAADEAQRAFEEAYQESTDFWSEILTGVIEGDIEDVLKNMLKRSAVQFGAEMLAQMTGNFAGFNVSALLGPGSFVTGGGAGAGGAAGAGAGAAGAAGGYFGGFNPALGPLAAIALTAPYLKTGYDQGSASGGFDSAPWYAKGAGLIGGFWGGQFGGGKGAEQQWRDQGRAGLRDRGITDGEDSFALFGGGRGSLSPGGEFSGFSSGGEKYGGFGSVLSMASGGDNSLKELYANALSEADSFNSAAQTTIGLLSDMGVSAEESQQMLIDAYNEGAISLGEFNEGMDAAAILARDDLGSVDEGFQLLAETIDGPPKDSLKALQLTFAEIKQSGVQDTEGLLAVIEQKMGPEAREVFKRLADAGITQFTDFNTLSAGQIQLLFNEMTNLKQPFDDVGSAGESAGRRGADGLGKIESKLGDIKRKAKEAKDALEDVGNAV